MLVEGVYRRKMRYFYLEGDEDEFLNAIMYEDEVFCFVLLCFSLQIPLLNNWNYSNVLYGYLGFVQIKTLWIPRINLTKKIIIFYELVKRRELLIIFCCLNFHKIVKETSKFNRP